MSQISTGVKYVDLWLRSNVSADTTCARTILSSAKAATKRYARPAWSNGMDLIIVGKLDASRKVRKKMTKLERCWINQLRLSGWIADNWVRGKLVVSMKKKWLASHGFKKKRYANCFFCEFAGGLPKKRRRQAVSPDCDKCPGRLVSKRFDCRLPTYSYYGKPRKFYQKIVSLRWKEE